MKKILYCLIGICSMLSVARADNPTLIYEDNTTITNTAGGSSPLGVHRLKVIGGGGGTGNVNTSSNNTYSGGTIQTMDAAIVSNLVVKQGANLGGIISTNNMMYGPGAASGNIVSNVSLDASVIFPASIIQTNTAQTLTSKTLMAPLLSNPSVQAGALTMLNGTCSWNVAATQFATLTLTGACFFATPANVTNSTYALKTIQDATGGRVPTWSTSFHWPVQTVPVTYTNAGATNIYTFISFDGSTLDGTCSTNR